MNRWNISLNARHLLEISKVHLLLIEFNITYVTQKSIRGQAFADHLVDDPFDWNEPMADFFPDESIISIELEKEHANGACSFTRH